MNRYLICIREVLSRHRTSTTAVCDMVQNVGKTCMDKEICHLTRSEADASVEDRKQRIVKVMDLSQGAFLSSSKLASPFDRIRWHVALSNTL